MKYPNIPLWKVEAVWNKLGGEEGVTRFLRSEPITPRIYAKPETNRTYWWHEFTSKVLTVMVYFIISLIAILIISIATAGLYAPFRGTPVIQIVFPTFIMLGVVMVVGLIAGLISQYLFWKYPRQKPPQAN
jgi:hypothetical protein